MLRDPARGYSGDVLGGGAAVTRHIERARAQLGDLAVLADRTQRTERRILEQAKKRLADVEAALKRARPGVEFAPDAAQRRYRDLIAERGQLHIVIAQANKNLGK